MRLRPESLAFLLFISALGGITPLSIDMGLPALEAIGRSLQIAPASAALTLSFFLVGFAFGPIVLGPLSDRFGRRPILLAGCALFVVAGIGCALTPSLPVLLFWRLLQGIGAGAGSTLSLAIVRDSFEGAAARAQLSYVSTVGAVAPMIAPILGAMVLALGGWRSIYGFLSVTGLALLLTVYFCFRETHHATDSTALHPRRLLANYARIFRNPISLGYTLVAALSFGCMFSYVSSSPLVMMSVLGVTPSAYGWTFAATAFGIMTGAFINGRLNTRGISGAALLQFGLTLSLATALVLLAISFSGYVSIATILPVLVLNTFCAGFIGANANHGVMHPMPDIAGVASAVLGSTRMLTGAAASVLISVIFDGHTAHAMAMAMTGFALASFAAYWLIVRVAERPVPVEEEEPLEDEPDFHP